MNINYKLLGISSFCAAAIGFAASTLVINSQNGYVGSMIFLPIFLLVSVLCLFLLIASIFNFILGNKSLGLYLVVSAFLLPASFMASCLTAKYFDIGAYHQEPMRPIPARR